MTKKYFKSKIARDGDVTREGDVALLVDVLISMHKDSGGTPPHILRQGIYRRVIYDTGGLTVDNAGGTKPGETMTGREFQKQLVQ